MIEAREICFEQVRELLGNPSKVTHHELMGASPHTLWEAIRLSCETVAWFYDDKLVVLVGVECSTVVNSTANVWIITTAEIEKTSFQFLRKGRIYLDYLRGKYSRVICTCRTQKLTGGDRWLKLLGFSPISRRGEFTVYKLKGKANE